MAGLSGTGPVLHSGSGRRSRGDGSPAAGHDDPVGGLDGLRITPGLSRDLDRVGRAFGPVARDYYRERSHRPGALLIAQVGQLVVGAVFVSTEPAHESAIVRHLGMVPMLHKLMVDEKVRHKRIGTRLIAAAEGRLRKQGRRRLAVGVDTDNPGAARLYRRLGYREWSHGLLETIREDIKDGKVILLPDECHVFIKHL